MFVLSWSLHLWILPRTVSKIGPNTLQPMKAQWLRKSPIPMFPEISQIEVSTLLQKLWLGKNLAPSKKSWNVPQKEKVDYC